MENRKDNEQGPLNKTAASTDMNEESVWFRRRMNRVFREQGGIKKIPHPEVDTVYERIRSKLFRIFFVTRNKIKKLFQKK